MRFNVKLLLCTLSALNLVFADEQQSLSNSRDQREPFRIAIIGAGAAGSSAAYHLSKFARESNLDTPINITIFESEHRIGGRTTTVDALNDPRYPIELGASIFVEINEILYNATQDFRLHATGHIYESTGADFDLGVWDGTSFVFTISNDESSGLKGTLGNWWEIAKILWKYGLSPFRLQSIRKSVIGKFLRLYHDVYPFKDLTWAAEEVDLLSVTGQTGTELLAAAGVGVQFSSDLVQASSRVNYAQNLIDFHGLETMVCMSTDGAMSVRGGNWQIFDKMVRESGATVNLNTTIRKIETSGMIKKSTVTYGDGAVNSGDESMSSLFDKVILAAPFNASIIKLDPPPTWQPNKAEYVSLHVTLFTSAFRPNPQFFGLEQDQDHLVPDAVLTTLPSYIDPSGLGRGVDGVGPTKFWSLSTLRTIHPTKDTEIPDSIPSGTIPFENLIPPNPESPQWPRRAADGKQYVYKIFSPAPLSANFLVRLFGWHNHPALSRELASQSCDKNFTSQDSKDSQSNHVPITTLSKELVTWTYEKRWNSYPYLPPTTEFDCFDIYDCKDHPPPGDSLDNHGTDWWSGRLYYTSPIESFISTMETSALSGRNIARLIMDELETRSPRHGAAGLAEDEQEEEGEEEEEEEDDVVICREPL